MELAQHRTAAAKLSQEMKQPGMTAEVIQSLLAGMSHEGLCLVSPKLARGQQEQSSSLGSVFQWLVTGWQLLPRAGTLLGARVPRRSLKGQGAPYCHETV